MCGGCCICRWRALKSIGDKETKPNTHNEVQRNSLIYLPICFSLAHYLFADISNEYIHAINGNLQTCNNSGVGIHTKYIYANRVISLIVILN